MLDRNAYKPPENRIGNAVLCESRATVDQEFLLIVSDRDSHHRLEPRTSPEERATHDAELEAVELVGRPKGVRQGDVAVL